MPLAISSYFIFMLIRHVPVSWIFLSAICLPKFHIACHFLEKFNIQFLQEKVEIFLNIFVPFACHNLDLLGIIILLCI